MSVPAKGKKLEQLSGMIVQSLAASIQNLDPIGQNLTFVVTPPTFPPPSCPKVKLLIFESHPLMSSLLICDLAAFEKGAKENSSRPLFRFETFALPPPLPMNGQVRTHVVTPPGCHPLDFPDGCHHPPP